MGRKSERDGPKKEPKSAEFSLKRLEKWFFVPKFAAKNCEGLSSSSFIFTFVYCSSMIDKDLVGKLVAQWLEGKEYFLTDLTVSPDSRIVVEIDHEEGVWIDDCVELSRFIEGNLNREEEDFELEVGSAGIGQPFKVHRQYEIHQGDEVEVLTLSGGKFKGVLGDVDESGFSLTFQEKVKEEGMKRPKLVEREARFSFSEVKQTKCQIDFK